MTKKSYYLLIIVTVTVLTTLLHLVSMRAFSPHVVLEELYYLPLLLGALRFTLRGAILTWLFVSVAYLLFFFPPWTTTLPEIVDRTLHLILSGLMTFVVALLVERERQNRAQVERERYLAGIGRVATVIVHDLKTPLISILGYARRISEGKGDLHQGIGAITESAQSMQRIVNEVLDFAKPMQPDLKDGDLCAVIRRAVEVCRTKAVEKGVALTEDLPQGPLIFAMDAFHLERGLVNLIGNAIEASPAGEVVVISAAAQRKGVEIIVKDRGIGMDQALLAHLFEPFFTTKPGGTGLGMPIAKKVCEEHGGDLAIDSQPGLGTEARIRLPRGGR